MEINWRDDISEIETAEDIDPVSRMISIRHHYLSVAKDMIKHNEEHDLVPVYIDVAEGIQDTLERLMDPIDLLQY